MDHREEVFDVVVVGAGPAGSTAATLVAMQGHRVLMIEQETMPIYKVGESLLPSTIHGICALLGVTDEMKAANFVRKLGGTFRWGKSKEPWTFAFAASSQFPGPTSYAYQVERMKFDTILANNARRKGVDVREQHSAAGLTIEDGRITGIDIVDDRKNRFHVKTQYVVDASGHGSPLARYAGERVYSTFFRNLAVFGYFHNGKRLPPPLSGNIFSVAFEKGWMWYIPLSPELTSVGVVIGHEFAPVLRNRSKEEAYAELLAECPPVRDLLSEATRVTEGPYGQVRVRKDFSYCNTEFWRPGLVLVGDAACFIDPVFSSGVHLATYSGLLAARSINTCLSGALSETEVFTEFQRRYLREYKLFHDFLVAFYDLDQDLDAYYWAARRVLGASEMGAESFVRLVGGMGGSGERLFQADGESQIPLQGLGTQLFPAASGAGEMYVDGGASAAEAAMTRDRFMADLTAEAVQMQIQASRIPFRYAPMFEDGLVPSMDGCRWASPAGAR